MRTLVWLGLAAAALGCSTSSSLATRVAEGSVSTARPLPDVVTNVRGALADDGVQGLAHDASHLFITTTRRIWRIPHGQLSQGGQPTGGVLPFGGRFQHLGDLDQHEGVLYIPLDEDSFGSRGGIAALRTDLTPIGIQPFAIVPWCAIDPRTGRLYTSRFHDDRLQVHRIELTADHFALRFEREVILQVEEDGEPVPLGTIARIQGGDISPDGKLYLASDGQGVGVLVFDADTGLLIERLPFDHAPRIGPFTNDEVEGVDFRELVGESIPHARGQLSLLLHDEFPKRRYTLKRWLVE